MREAHIRKDCLNRSSFNHDEGLCDSFCTLKKHVFYNDYCLPLATTTTTTTTTTIFISSRNHFHSSGLLVSLELKRLLHEFYTNSTI